jgi:hypothetical protein
MGIYQDRVELEAFEGRAIENISENCIKKWLFATLFLFEIKLSVI